MKDKSFMFDEVTEAEKVIREGFNGNIDYKKMYLIAKYFRETFGYGAVRLERELIKFCLAQNKNFNPINEMESIKKWVSTAMRYGLRKVDEVLITQKEIDFLKTIVNQKERKIFFVMLVLSKALKQSTKTKGEHQQKSGLCIWYSNFGDIIKMSKITGVTEIGLAKILHNHSKDFLFCTPEKETVKLLYGDENSAEGIKVSNLDEPVLSYNMIFGKENAYCIGCHKEFVRTAGNQLHCRECAKQIRRDKQRELMKVRRALARSLKP